MILSILLQKMLQNFLQVLTQCQVFSLKKKPMKTLNILSYFGKLIAKTSNFHAWSTCVAQNLQRMPFLGHTPPCTRPLSSTNIIFLIVERNFTVALEAKYIQKNWKNNSLCTFYPRCILRSWN
jgi:hypothetical protein